MHLIMYKSTTVLGEKPFKGYTMYTTVDKDLSRCSLMATYYFAHSLYSLSEKNVLFSKHETKMRQTRSTSFVFTHEAYMQTSTLSAV